MQTIGQYSPLTNSYLPSHRPSLCPNPAFSSARRLLYGPCFNAVQMAFVYKVSGQKWAQVVKSMQVSPIKVSFSRLGFRSPINLSL